MVADPRIVARIINLAHRFQCRATKVDSSSDDAVTRARFEFAGPDGQLVRLRAQIDRILAFENVFAS